MSLSLYNIAQFFHFYVTLRLAFNNQLSPQVQFVTYFQFRLKNIFSFALLQLKEYDFQHTGFDLCFNNTSLDFNVSIKEIKFLLAALTAAKSASNCFTTSMINSIRPV